VANAFGSGVSDVGRSVALTVDVLGSLSHRTSPAPTAIAVVDLHPAVFGAAIDDLVVRRFGANAIHGGEIDLLLPVDGCSAA